MAMLRFWNHPRLYNQIAPYVNYAIIKRGQTIFSDLHLYSPSAIRSNQHARPCSQFQFLRVCTGQRSQVGTNSTRKGSYLGQYFSSFILPTHCISLHIGIKFEISKLLFRSSSKLWNMYLLFLLHSLLLWIILLLTCNYLLRLQIVL
jgi:hypothetical protein